MTAIRSEQPVQETSQPIAPESTEQPMQAAGEQSAAEPQPDAREREFEADIRNFVRRDVVSWRRQRPERPDGGHLGVDNVNSLIHRVSGQSASEIDQVIGELQIVRNILRDEGDRLRRDLAGYANMSQAAMSSMKIIGESMAQWRSTLGNARRA